MTEKRFVVVEDETDIYDENYHDIVCRCAMSDDAEKCCKLLNEQSETIQQLQHRNQVLEFFRKNTMKTLKERYAQLSRITKRYGSMHKPCKDLLAEICKELGVELE